MTGGASGIGRALAESCRAAGMKVVIADIEAEPLAATCEALAATGVRTDVTDPASVTELASLVHDRFGHCDLLFNNAGVGGGGRMIDQTLNDWNWVIDVNLKGVVHVLHAFLPSMVASERGGHIVNTASIAGLAAVVSGPYTATKYAVVGISETLRHELAGTRVGVSVLCPGLVQTNLGASERNRPTGLTNENDVTRRSSWALPTTTRPVILEPSVVAEMVMKAVTNDEFWILTDPSLLALASPRYDELRAIALGN